MRFVTQSKEEIKTELMHRLEHVVDALLDATDEDISPRELEKKLWTKMLEACRAILCVLIARLCWRVTEADLRARSLQPGKVRLRFDQDYWGKITTTFGRITVPWFAYRDSSRPAATVTRSPARAQLFPFYARCRSSELCLEWEARLGSDYPFRHAQEALGFFSHGAVGLEDNTIASHMASVGQVVDRSWLYRTPEKIAELLADRATHDEKTGYPIVYISSDAHAIKRYTNDTWEASWKMANGIRLWSIDRYDGRVIHLGGEYTWGDCRAVGRAFKWLIDNGILPPHGRYGADVHALYVWVSDGMPWFEDHILPLFDQDALVTILDAKHLLDRFAKYVGQCFRKKSRKAKRVFEQLAILVTGKPRPKSKPERQKRRGHKKRRGPRSPKPKPSYQFPNHPAEHGHAQVILDTVRTVHPTSDRHKEALEDLTKYLAANTHRVDYPEYRTRGFQIGSGAMESMHKTGSQQRLKIPGARWLEQTAQAIFNLRMMRFVGNWGAFWSSSGLTALLQSAFSPSEISSAASTS